MKIEIPKKKLEHLIRMKNILVATMIFLIILIFFVVLNILNSDKTTLGLKIAEAKIGGLNFDQVEEKLKTINNDFLNKKLVLGYQDQRWQVDPKKLGIEIDITKTALIISEYGHNGKNIALNSWQQFKSLLGKNLPVIWSADEEKMDNFLRDNLGSIHRPAQNATLAYDLQKQEFSVIPEKNGISINKEKMKMDIEKNITGNKENIVHLSLIEDISEIKGSETEKAREKINKIIASLPISINIIENNKNSSEEIKKEIDKIEKEKLLDLIEFEPIPDAEMPNNKILGMITNREKIKEYLISLAPLINHEPIDAKLTFKDGKVTVFTLSQDGMKLEIDDNISNISSGVLNNNDVVLKITKTMAAISTENINNLGITAFLGKGVSSFAGSPLNRAHNIKISTAKFNGTLIKSGEAFSFNEILGEVGPEQGYEPELVIKKDKTVPEYGGGICQVSTTIFRAAINSGLKVTERFAHAFPVKYYNPQGFDATIYPPSPDLKFINDTPANILLQSKIVGNELTFEIYGTEDFRRVKIDGPNQYDIKEDGSMKAVLTQEVYDKDGNLMFKKTFYSNYRSPDLYPVDRNPLE
jgi:vancomycin resistance protein YoaR